MARDYYAVLEVGAGATPAQVRRAYQRLARRYSPDVNIWDREARSLFEEIVQAYRVLGDPTARAVYDRQGRARPPAHRRAEPSKGGRRGDEAHVVLPLTFAQAASGVSAELGVDRLSPCGACGATGGRPGSAPEICAHCGGTGSVWRESGPRGGESCPACLGAGRRVSEPCPRCHGRGVSTARAVVRAAIPAGVDTGAQVRIPAEGHAGPFGGPRGDLVVITRVQPDPSFSRKGDNLHSEVTITIAEAVLGARVSVRTLDGTAELVVPSGTQSGQVLRLRSRGLPRLAGEGRGDLHVTVRVQIPRGLDARTQEIFRELGRLLPRQEGRP